jgi:hypothetical protein
MSVVIQQCFVVEWRMAPFAVAFPIVVTVANGMGANYLPRVARNVSLPGERHVASVLFYAEAAGNGPIATRGRRDERALQPRRHAMANDTN